MKTLFITIPQALLIRNILRSGGYDLFKKRGYKLIIFIQCKAIPEYLQKEFANENTDLIAVGNFKIGKIHHAFILFTHFLIWSPTSRRYFRYGKQFINKPRWISLLYLLGVRIFSCIRFFKPLVRWVEKTFFDEKNMEIEDYFKKYKPDLVFATSAVSKMDIIFMKAAKRRGIPTAGMPKSWDNLTRMYLRFPPDYFLVQNEYLKDRLIRWQDIPQDKIYVIGFPQFDWYRRPEIIRTREEHFKKIGLNPALPLIFFGSQGTWYDKDYQVVEQIYEWVKNDELVKPCQMLVRPHFNNVRKSPLQHFKGKPKVVYDESYHISDVFVDNWDPLTPEIIDFVNNLYHCDVLVIVLSTLALDAACLDKPIINVLFGSKYRKGEDITPQMLYTEHYSWILESKGTSLIYTLDELKNCVNQYLLDPNIKSKERAVLREKVCYKVDGKSSERMVAAIEDILQKS